MNRKHRHTATSTRRASSLFAFLLLFLYLAGNLQPEALHHLSHNDEADAHTAVMEKDPCHRALYHAALGDGCEHTAHYTTPKKCAACHLIFHAAHLVITSDEASITYAVVPYTVADDALPCLGDIAFSSSRAPPVA
ncbi:hypothetical protein [Dawidia soli]|uniref:Uncharacterized protein n=1 Tax=Dawidia soli TaxID=2782352 RepID=A0AAP2GK00_9BACT|nr:hypothetical protein [Dawidia soli]MBT1689075.1 hypothetical protein [Dawidia soli]